MTSKSPDSSHAEQQASHEQDPPSAEALDRLLERLDEALGRLEQSESFAKTNHQQDVFHLAEGILRIPEGLSRISALAHRFHSAGLFAETPWEFPSRLQPSLVKGSLEAPGITPVMEILSELRLLAFARGLASHERFTEQDARDFLMNVVALNLDYVFPPDTEVDRIKPSPHRSTVERLFTLLIDSLPLHQLFDEVLRELEAVSAQRPIRVNRLEDMVRLAAKIQDSLPEDEHSERLTQFLRAVRGASELAQDTGNYRKYRAQVSNIRSGRTLRQECIAFAEAMRNTGMTSPQHAVLLRHVAEVEPKLLSEALGLDRLGETTLENSLDVAKNLVFEAVHPATYDCIYGFAHLLERGLLNRPEVNLGIQRLLDIDLDPEVRRNLLAKRGFQEGLTAESVLLAGTLAVLGQPLGVGQGKNPTCQSARGISLWSRHAPSFLIDLVVYGARDNSIMLRFDGLELHSANLVHGLVSELDLDLDPVSIVLVPHLDRLYNEMMRMSALKGEDGHKYVNPGLYGHWVPDGFSACLDLTQTKVVDFETFVRRFYATHHPKYNNNHPMVYLNPVGLFITNNRGEYLGAHAVSLLRVDLDDDEDLRAYFFNPNNEGRQDWGQGVKVSVNGHGEVEGESSLPFAQFLSRLYAYHYNPNEMGDLTAVDQEDVDRVTRYAKESWGQQFEWVEGPLDLSAIPVPPSPPSGGLA